MSQKQHDRRVDYVEFTTNDIAATKLFYETVFGWKFTDYGSTYTSFADGRINGGFALDEKARRGDGGALVVMYAVDLEALQESVKANGGRIVAEIFDFPGGRRFHFADPAGNELAVWSDR